MNIQINTRRDKVFLVGETLHVDFSRSGRSKEYRAFLLPAAGYRIKVSPLADGAALFLETAGQPAEIETFETTRLAERARDRALRAVRRANAPTLRIIIGVAILAAAWSALSLSSAFSVRSLLTAKGGMSPLAQMGPLLPGDGGQMDLAALNEQLGALMKGMPGGMPGGLGPAQMAAAMGGTPQAGMPQQQVSPEDLKKDMAEKPLDYAIFFGPGHKQATPEKTLYIFSDPLCPFCADLEKSVRLLPKDVALRVMPVAIKPGADQVVRNIMCSSDPAKSWRAHFNGETLKKQAACEKSENAMKSNYAVFKMLGFSATPAMATGSNKTHQGALFEPELRDFLGLSKSETAAR